MNRRRDDRSAAEQVADARMREGLERKNELLQLQELLKQPGMQEFMWRVISRCKIFGEPMQSNFGMVGYGLGQMSIGKWLVTEINEAEPMAWFEMQRRHLKQEPLEEPLPDDDAN